ncbi:MAG: extracellular solute-binding protein [Acetatifactor sp.]
MRRKVGIKRILALALAAALTLTACGGGEDEQQVEGFVYVPEFVDLTPQEGEDSMNEPVLRGENLYYSVYSYDEETGEGGQKYYCQNLTTGEKKEMPLDLKIEGSDYSYPMGGLQFDQDNNIICLMSASKSDENGNYSQSYYMMKFDPEGNKLLEQDITEAMKLEGSDSSYAQSAVVDPEGRVYLNVSGGGMNSGNSFIVVLDAEGALLAKIDTGSDWISAMGVASNGTVLITRYGNGAGMECLEVDLANKALGKTHNGLPSSYNSGSLISTPDGGLLVNDGSRLWKYDLETETTEEILTWTDCDINGSYVQMIQTLEDGRIAVLSSNWASNTQELAYLTKTEAAKVTQKEIITLATMWSDQNLQEAVVNFNKKSDAYKVRIITYFDDTTEWTETKYQDAVTALNNAITSSNCPDIIDLSNSNTSSYVSKGLLLDLAPYLESSSVKRGDLMESVLDAYTFDGTLVCIPTDFRISTIMGRTSQLGDRTSWTIKDVMEFANQYPDAKLLNYSSKSSMLSTCLQYSSEAFIDYNAGTCNFESQDFLDVLEFCNTFDAETEWDREGESFPKQISDGKILLNDVSIGEMDQMQMYSMMFNEPVTFIGYPTVDGSNGNRINGENCYAITTKSKHADGAWSFIESLLQYEPVQEFGYRNGFPIRKDMLEETFALAMKENGSYDENGEIMLDENGEPMIWPKTTWGYDDWEAEIYAATPEQVQAVRDLIDSAVAASNNDETVLSIISEEAQGYFEGQKSAKDVAGVIQSRVQTYISENS